MASEQVYRTIDVERRGYGRRYTWLPVDSLSRTEFVIDFTGSYTRPDMIDIRRDDIVRWREGERQIEARVVAVDRNGEQLSAKIENAHVLPPEAFHP
jgi:hypothetical protein